MRDDRDLADPLDAARARLRLDALHHCPRRQIDDRDVRLGVCRDECERSRRRKRGRHVTQRKRRRSGGEQEAAPVHAGDTSGEGVRVRPGEERVDRVLEHFREQRDLA